MRRTLLLVLAGLALGACSDKRSPPAAALPTPSRAAPATPGVLIPAATRQLVTAITDDWSATHATLQLWQRTPSGWQAAGETWPGVVGKTGSAWGAGVHGTGAPAGRDGPVKREGDGKSPAGVFAIRDAYGMVEDPEGMRLPYATTQFGDLECVDDPASEHYAKIVDRKQVASDWESAEQLLRDDDLYMWIVDIAHNPERTPKLGSCIFLHVWGGPESVTLGCTAMAASKLVKLMAALDPAAQPLFVLLPRAEYQALAVPWGLPAQ